MTRKKLFRFIVDKVFKIQEGEKLGIAKYLMYILFPLKSYLIFNQSYRYKPETDIYIINGVEFSGEFFEAFKGIESGDREYVIRNRDGKVWVESREVSND